MHACISHFEGLILLYEEVYKCLHYLQFHVL